MPFKMNPFTEKPDFYETSGGGVTAVVASGAGGNGAIGKIIVVEIF